MNNPGIVTSPPKSPSYVFEAKKFLHNGSVLNIEEEESDSLLLKEEETINPQLQFLEKYIFPILLPILKRTIFFVKYFDGLERQKSMFNGLDYISQSLWNKNPNYPERAEENLNIFLIPWVQEWLKEHPRPYMPKSWVWTPTQGALRIQRYYRGYLIRKKGEVQEMRDFWKELETDKEKEDVV